MIYLNCEENLFSHQGEKMDKLRDLAIVKEQYSNANNLNIRISIHDKYSINKQGFGNWIFEQYKIKENFKILELGCGNGSMWVDCCQKLPTNTFLILTDFSEGMLNETRKNISENENVVIKQVDIQEIPFEDNQFDVVIANMMLYHVPDLNKGLTEVKRVLKGDGTFYSATYGENGITEYLQDLLYDYGVKKSLNTTFTLQNGTQTLYNHFTLVEKRIYEDYLEVTNTEDLIDYLLSLTSMVDFKNIPRDEIRNLLNSKMVDGKIHVPKEYGIFISTK